MPTNRSTDRTQTADDKLSADQPGASQPETAAPDEPTAQASEYTAPYSTVYPSVPLTAHPAIPARKATDDEPAVPAQPATVFAWPDGAPDNRWQPTTKTPNQRPDNEPAQPTEA